MYKEKDFSGSYESPEDKEYIVEEIKEPQQQGGSVRKQAMTLFADEMVKKSGSIAGSPMVRDGRVYFGAYDSYFYVLNSVTGKLEWRFKCNGPLLSYPRIADGIIYFASYDGYVYAVSTEGGLIWKYRRSSYSGSSPAFCENIVYAGTAGSEKELTEMSLFALDPKSGKLLWKFITNGDNILPALGNDMAIFGSGDRHLYAVSAKNGTLLWKFMASDGIDTVPCICDEKGNEIWSVKNQPEKMPHINKGMIYFGSWDNNVYALTLDGREIWRYRTNGPIMFSSPTVYKGIVLIGSLDSHIYALDAFTGQLKWRFKTDMAVVADPIVYKDTVYIGSVDKNLYALSLDGQLKWKYETNGYLSSSVEISNDTIYFTSWDGNIRALTLDGEFIWAFKTGSLEPVSLDVTNIATQISIMNRRILRLWRPETIKRSHFKDSLVFRDHVTMGNDYNALKSYTSEPHYNRETPYNRRRATALL